MIGCYVYTSKEASDAWEDLWQPELNPFSMDAEWDGILFGTEGKQLEHVKKQNERRVWTLIRVGTCNGESLVPGFHSEKALGYLVTKVKRPEVFNEDLTVVSIPDDCSLHWNLC